MNTQNSADFSPDVLRARVDAYFARPESRAEMEATRLAGLAEAAAVRAALTPDPETLRQPMTI